MVDDMPSPLVDRLRSHVLLRQQLRHLGLSALFGIRDLRCSLDSIFLPVNRMKRAGNTGLDRNPGQWPTNRASPGLAALIPSGHDGMTTQSATHVL